MSPPSPDTLGLRNAALALPEGLPEVLDGALEALARSDWPGRAPSQVHALVACGLGTGGTAAAAAAALGAPHGALPFWVGRGASVPAFVDRYTVFFAVSSSGETDETVRAATAAAARGACIIAVGGDRSSALARAAQAAAWPWCPRGLPGPRTVAGLASGLVPVLVALAEAGLGPDPAPSLASAAGALARRGEQLDAAADELARRIGRTMPLLYGGEGVGAVAARWWKARINLNAKSPAFAGSLPSATYDEVAGWGQGGDITRQVVSLVLLRHVQEDPGVARLFDAVQAATDEVMADLMEVWAHGEDDLGRLLDLVLLGELVSLHLAGHEGVDPGPVPTVDEMHQVRIVASPSP